MSELGLLDELRERREGLAARIKRDTETVEQLLVAIRALEQTQKDWGSARPKPGWDSSSVAA